MGPSQTFNDHIAELKRRFLWVGLSIVVTAILGYVLREQMVAILQHPLGAPLFYSSPAGSFNFIIKLSTGIGIFVAMPVIIYNLLRFIEPALPHRITKIFFAKIIGASFALASAGIAFAYYQMIPLSLKFFAGYSTAEIKPLISADEYLSYIMGNMIAFALIFQIPLLILFINWVKPTKPKQLLKYQRHVIVGAFGLAVILPFTYDPISQFIVAVPIVILFYLSAILLWVVNRQPKKAKLGVFEFSTPKPYNWPASNLAYTPELATQTVSPTTISTVNASVHKNIRSLDGFIVQKTKPIIQNTLFTPEYVQPTAVIAMPPIIKPNIATHPRLSLDGIISTYKLAAS